MFQENVLHLENRKTFVLLIESKDISVYTRYMCECGILCLCDMFADVVCSVCVWYTFSLCVYVFGVHGMNDVCAA